MSNEVCQQPVCEYNNIPFTVDEVCNVAKNQSYILYCVLINIILIFSLFFIPAERVNAMPFIAVLVILPVVFFSVATIVFLVKLRNAMKKNVALTVFACILMFVNYVSLLVLVYHVISATKLLRSAGLKVGLLGVSSAELALFRERNRSIY